MSRAAWLAGWLLATIAIFPAAAQQAPLGAPQPDRTLRDPEFGVVARHIGLERQVDMLQWQATGSGYTKVWSPVAIDSSRFPADHQNPGALPLRTRRWLPRTVTIDGKPLDSAVLRTLGEWRDFRPSFSALPGNLAATFQPEGMGLGSAENPLQPAIGDLRIHWRDLILPPLDGLVELRDGRWQLLPATRAIRPRTSAPLRVPATVRESSIVWWLGGLAVMMVALLVGIGRRRQR
jgi:hypothetical protein